MTAVFPPPATIQAAGDTIIDDFPLAIEWTKADFVDAVVQETGCASTIAEDIARLLATIKTSGRYWKLSAAGVERYHEVLKQIMPDELVPPEKLTLAHEIANALWAPPSHTLVHTRIDRCCAVAVKSIPLST